VVDTVYGSDNDDRYCCWPLANLDSGAIVKIGNIKSIYKSERGYKQMVIIRLTRGGAKKRPFYHVVAADSRKPRDGRFIERLGYYNPIGKTLTKDNLNLDMDRINYWIATGAQPSERVQRLIDLFAQAQQQGVVVVDKDDKKEAKEAKEKKEEAE
jgi:small subunit ribosomal protein S16